MAADARDVIIVDGGSLNECFAAALDRAETILGTVALLELVSAAPTDSGWNACYHYRPMFPLT